MLDLDRSAYTCTVCMMILWVRVLTSKEPGSNLSDGYPGNWVTCVNTIIYAKNQNFNHWKNIVHQSVGMVLLDGVDGVT